MPVLDEAVREFVALEAYPSAKDRIAILCRTLHPVEATSAFLGYSRHPVEVPAP